MATHARRTRLSGRALFFAGLAAVAALSTVAAPADATFTDAPSVTANGFSTGSVTLVDNAAAAAMFAATGLAPGSTGSGCIRLTYTGGGTASVKMYVASGALTGSLGSYLQLKIEQGSGTALNCSDFVSSTTIYNSASSSADTLAAFAASSTNFGTGVGAWSPTANQTMSYRVSFVVLRNSSAKGATATVTFSWEADV